MFLVYILQNPSGRFYIGHTQNPGSEWLVPLDKTPVRQSHCAAPLTAFINFPDRMDPRRPEVCPD